MQTPDLHALRARREQFYVELRAQRRADLTAKRRASNIAMAAIEERLRRQEETEEDVLIRIRGEIERETDMGRICEVLSELKEQLVKSPLSSVQTSISLGIPKPLLHLFSLHRSNDLITLPVLTCITNLAAGQYPAALEVAKSGGIEACCIALETRNYDVCEQAIMALGNFAGDCIELRDSVIRCKAHAQILQLLRTAEMLPLSLTKTAAWAMSNFTRGSPPLPLSDCETCIPILSELLVSNDEMTITSALFAVSFLANGGADYIQVILNEKGLLETVIRAGDKFQSEARLPSLKVIGNIAAGDHLHTQHLIDLPIFPLLLRSMNSSSPAIRKEVFFTLSNICAGTLPQIDALLRDKIAKELVAGTEDYDIRVRKEAIWAVYNISKIGSDAQKERLMRLGLFASLKNAFYFPELDMSLLLLQTIENILTTALTFAAQLSIRTELEASGCWDEIEKLSHSANKDLSDLAGRLLDWEWVPDDSEEENDVPDS